MNKSYGIFYYRQIEEIRSTSSLRFSLCLCYDGKQLELSELYKYVVTLLQTSFLDLQGYCIFRCYDEIAKEVGRWVLMSEGWLSGTRYASVNRIPLDIWQQNFMFLYAPSITISSTCLSSIRLKSSADVTTAASRSQMTLRQTRRS